jgi:methylglyoxal synthase
VRTWNAFLTGARPGDSLFRKRRVTHKAKSPVSNLRANDRVLAMVAHDKMKLELCRFAVENASYIFENFDVILATGTTGEWIKKFMQAAKRGKEDIAKIRLCNSGPEGGDLQIAYAVVKGLCHKIVFLQDPSVSHPHNSDIRLFEQAVVSPGVHVELATNVESARFLIGPIGAGRSEP